MTIVNIDLRLPDGVTPAIGTILFTPTRRLHVDGTPDYVMPPAPLPVRLVAGMGSINLIPTDFDWAWVATEKIKGGTRRYFVVPDSETPIDYGDLVEVDPSSLVPLAEPEDAWWVALDNLILGGGGPEGDALLNHINSLTPHPEYDDLPDLSLQFENGLL